MLWCKIHCMICNQTHCTKQGHQGNILVIQERSVSLHFCRWDCSTIMTILEKWATQATMLERSNHLTALWIPSCTHCRPTKWKTSLGSSNLKLCMNCCCKAGKAFIASTGTKDRLGDHVFWRQDSWSRKAGCGHLCGDFGCWRGVSGLSEHWRFVACEVDDGHVKEAFPSLVEVYDRQVISSRGDLDANDETLHNYS